VKGRPDQDGRRECRAITEWLAGNSVHRWRRFASDRSIQNRPARNKVRAGRPYRHFGVGGTGKADQVSWYLAVTAVESIPKGIFGLTWLLVSDWKSPLFG
jgi:hypothetical protein